MKILVCGDRNYKDKEYVKHILTIFKNNHPDLEIIQGGCKGADILARDVGVELGAQVFTYPAHWHKYGRAAGPMRNKEMLDDNPDIKLVVAFHDDIENSKGTKDMINQADRRGIPRIVITKGNYNAKV